MISSLLQKLNKGIVLLIFLFPFSGIDYIIRNLNYINKVHMGINNYNFARLSTRVIAIMYDMIFKFIIVFPVWAIQIWLFKEKSWSYIDLVTRIDPIYYIILLSCPLQATFGMKLNNIKIIDKTGHRITLVRSVFRYLVAGSWYLIIAIITKLLNLDISWILLGLILPAFMHFHPQKQTYYDIICGTYIVELG